MIVYADVNRSYGKVGTCRGQYAFLLISLFLLAVCIISHGRPKCVTKPLTFSTLCNRVLKINFGECIQMTSILSLPATPERKSLAV